MADVKEKIKKLLALAESPNENEARSALLKAKELMIKNKIDQSEFETVEKQELKHVVCNEISWTTDSGEIWMVDLCNLICDNYLCGCAWSTPRGTRTHKLVITGLTDDVEICKSTIEYAVGFVRGRIKLEQRRRLQADRGSIAKGYALGFIAGLKFAFEEQKEEHAEWGLVAVQPQEVQDYMSGLGNRSVKTKQNSVDSLSYTKGERDGMEFNNRKAIAG